jgi:hypothetical protein
MALSTSVAISLHVNGWLAEQPVTITVASPPAAPSNVSSSVQVNATAGVLSQFGFLQLPAVRQVGQAVTLQLISNATNFTAVHANSTGWRVEMLQPDSSLVNHGFMQDGAVLPGLAGFVYQWTLNITEEKLTQVHHAAKQSMFSH